MVCCRPMMQMHMSAFFCLRTARLSCTTVAPARAASKPRVKYLPGRKKNLRDHPARSSETTTDRIEARSLYGFLRTADIALLSPDGHSLDAGAGRQSFAPDKRRHCVIRQLLHDKKSAGPSMLSRARSRNHAPS